MRISDWSSDVCSSDLRTIFSVLYNDLFVSNQAEARCVECRTRVTTSLAMNGMNNPAGVISVRRSPMLDPRQRGSHRMARRSEEHTSELQSLMRISYAVFCLKKKKKKEEQITTNQKNKEQQHETPTHSHRASNLQS